MTPSIGRSMERGCVTSTASAATTRAAAGAGVDVDESKKKKKKREAAGRRSGAAVTMNRCPSLEALAMAGCQSVPDHCSDGEEEEGMPPEHLRAFEAFLEVVVPADMVVASERQETARVRRGGKSRSYEDDMKEKLKLWARAVAKTTVGRS